MTPKLLILHRKSFLITQVHSRSLLVRPHHEISSPDTQTTLGNQIFDSVIKSQELHTNVYVVIIPALTKFIHPLIRFWEKNFHTPSSEICQIQWSVHFWHKKEIISSWVFYCPPSRSDQSTLCRDHGHSVYKILSHDILTLMISSRRAYHLLSNC